MPVYPDGRPTSVVPRTPASAFARPHLLARLDAPWDVAILQGPSGSGKSVLMAQWARARAETVAWRDLAQPRDGQAMSLPEHDGILVMDSVDELHDDALGSLAAAIDRRSGVRLLVATRHPSVVRAIARSSDSAILVVGPDDLRVDDEELQRFDPGSSPSRRSALLADSGGLIVAVCAAVQGTEDVVRERFRARTLSSASKRPPGYRDALPRLALVRQLDEPTAAALGMSAELLSAFQDDGLGSFDEGWLGVTGFAAAALEPLASTIPVDEQRALQRTALEGAMGEERPVEALRLALALGDLDLASDIVIRHGMLFLSDLRGIAEAFSMMSVSGLDAHPILQLLLAQCLNVDRTTRLRGFHLMGRAALHMFGSSKSTGTRESLVLRAIGATLLRFTPLADRALPRTRKALAALDALDWSDRDQLAVSGAYLVTHVGLTAMYGGDADFADANFERAYTDMRLRRRDEAVDSLSLWAAHQAARGELVRARELMRTAESARWPKGWRAGLQGQALDLAAAIVGVEDGAIESARRSLAAQAPIEDVLEHWALFAVVQTWCDAMAGEFVAGLVRLRTIRRHRGWMTTTSVARSWLDSAESLLALLAGDVSSAKKLAQAAARRTAGGSVALLRVQVALGRDADALSTAGRLWAVENKTVRDEVEADSLAAVLALRAGRHADADALIERARAAAVRTGLRVPFVALIDRDREALAARAAAVGADDLADVVRSARPLGEAARITPVELTAREAAVLRALHEVTTIDALAERLFVSRNTVKSQLRSLYRKLGVHSRADAILRAAALGLSEPGGALGGMAEAADPL